VQGAPARQLRRIMVNRSVAIDDSDNSSNESDDSADEDEVKSIVLESRDKDALDILVA
jgi:hypothetical protein